ncbi:MAG: 50S ribosomal protein L11 methyltransferase [Acidobacteriaceae bacterium]|nr:50S ribosomal protein L11 methyltransferase [Acidobacteriaceae bacterium]
MYLLLLACSSEEVDRLSAELWERGVAGIQETGAGLIASFEEDEQQAELLERFASYSPEWKRAPATDWIEHTYDAWPPRLIGNRFFLAPVWSDAQTPPGRERIVHNPGLASGTGEHPCTQLALLALEKLVRPETVVLDIGAGSGILGLAALRLGASAGLGLDPDENALAVARENFSLNSFEPALVAGTVDCLATGIADITVANINATVLLSILDDLLRVTRPAGTLILTGFTDAELQPFLQVFPNNVLSSLNEWRCVAARLS